MKYPKPMSIEERYDYLQTMYERYQAAQGRKERSALLDEMQAATGLNRVYLIQLMQRRPERRPRRRRGGDTPA